MFPAGKRRRRNAADADFLTSATRWVRDPTRVALLVREGAYARLYAAQFSGAAVDADTGEAPAPASAPAPAGGRR